MQQQPGTITVRVDEGSSGSGGIDSIDFGTILTTFPDCSSVLLKVHYNAGEQHGERLPVTFSLSESLQSYSRIRSICEKKLDTGEVCSNLSADDCTNGTGDNDDILNKNFLHCLHSHYDEMNICSSNSNNISNSSSSSSSSNIQFLLHPNADTEFTVLLTTLPQTAANSNSNHGKDSNMNVASRLFCEGFLEVYHGTNKTLLSSTPLHGYISPSVIKVDKQVLDFGRCSLGVWSSFMDFSVENLSETSTYINLSSDFSLDPLSADQKQLCILVSKDPTKNNKSSTSNVNANVPNTINYDNINDLLPSLSINDEINDHGQYEQYEQYSVTDMNRVLIPSQTRLKFKIAIRCFTPDEYGSISNISNGQMEYWLSVQNEKNVLNLFYIRVVVVSTVEELADKLYFSCGNEIPFKDCYINCHAFRDILLKNNYPEVTTISLFCDEKQYQKQVYFELLQDREEDDSPFFVGDDMGLLKHNRNTSSTKKNHHNSSSSKNQFIHYQNQIHDNRSSPISSSWSLDQLHGKQQHKQQQHEVIVPKKPTKNRLIDHITLRPAQYCRLRVWYNPSSKIIRRHPSNDPNQSKSSETSVQMNYMSEEEERGRLELRKFQIVFQIPTGETRRITLNSKVCESTIKLIDTSEHLGDCDLFTTYTTQVPVLNCCDLPTTVKISYVSQCVSTNNIEQFTIRPHDTFNLPITFIPRQVNPSYHKEITFFNLNNNINNANKSKSKNDRTNDNNDNGNDSNSRSKNSTSRKGNQVDKKDKDTSIVFTVFANCVDKQGISLHAMYYKILKPNSAYPITELDFGITVSNHITLRCFIIENISDEKLLLKLYGHNNNNGNNDSGNGNKKIGSHNHTAGSGASDGNYHVHPNDSEEQPWGIDVFIPDKCLPLNTWAEKRLLTNDQTASDQFNSNGEDDEGDDFDSNHQVVHSAPYPRLPPRIDDDEYESDSVIEDEFGIERFNADDEETDDFVTVSVGTRRGRKKRHRARAIRSYRTAVSLVDPGIGREYLPEECVAAHEKIDIIGRACEWGHSLELKQRNESCTSSLNLMNESNEKMVSKNAHEFDDYSQYRADGEERTIPSGGEESLTGEENWNELLKILHQQGDKDNGLLESMPTDHSGHEGEIKYMERQLLPITRLHNAIHDGYLHKSDKICIPSKKKSIVIISLTLNDKDVRSSTKLRSIEKKLIIDMDKKDVNNRELILTARACKSLMGVSPLSQMNFGVIPNNEHKHKQFSIINLCQAPLLYEIVIDGPFDDHNELRLNESNRHNGVVRPYSTKDVRFIYAPSMPGSYQHRFLVENILDRWASCQLVVKATVIPKPSSLTSSSAGKLKEFT